MALAIALQALAEEAGWQFCARPSNIRIYLFGEETLEGVSSLLLTSFVFFLA